MLAQYIRLIKSDNGALTDKSLDNQDLEINLDFELVASEDYWYVGQRLPCNNFFMQVDTPNATASVLGVEYWDNSEWRNALDILDGTSSAGVSIAKSGIVQFSPDSRYSWSITGDTVSGKFPTELATTKITNVYWFRVKFSANIDAGTLIKRLVYAFTTTQNVNSKDSTIKDFYDSFGVTGKADWDDEIVTASLDLARDLKKRAVIRNRGQILELEDVSIPCDWKVLENIYWTIGGDYLEKHKGAIKKYEATIDTESMTLDKNKNARIDHQEIDSNFGSVLKRN